MRVWEMLPNDKNSANLAPIEDDRKWTIDYDKTFDGRSKVNSWKPWHLRKAYGFKTRPITDISCFVPGVKFVLSNTAVEALYDLIKDDVELLPVFYEEEKRWLMNVTTILDCVDYEKSTFSIFPSGRISLFDAVELKEDAIRGHNVFKLADRPNGFVLTSDVFRERALQVDPKGLDFFLVWDSTRTEPIRLPLGYIL